MGDGDVSLLRLKHATHRVSVMHSMSCFRPKWFRR